MDWWPWQLQDVQSARRKSSQTHFWTHYQKQQYPPPSPNVVAIASTAGENIASHCSNLCTQLLNRSRTITVLLVLALIPFVSIQPFSSYIQNGVLLCLCQKRSRYHHHLADSVLVIYKCRSAPWEEILRGTADTRVSVKGRTSSSVVTLALCPSWLHIKAKFTALIGNNQKSGRGRSSFHPYHGSRDDCRDRSGSRNWLYPSSK